MHPLADLFTPPYYAVIFSSMSSADQDGYDEVKNRMLELAPQQNGYLGMESARDAIGITVSYWDSLDAIKQWKANTEHQHAQKLGRQRWYQSFRLRIAKVEREYGMD